MNFRQKRSSGTLGYCAYRCVVSLSKAGGEGRQRPERRRGHRLSFLGERRNPRGANPAEPRRDNR